MGLVRVTYYSPLLGADLKYRQFSLGTIRLEHEDDYECEFSVLSTRTL